MIKRKAGRPKPFLRLIKLVSLTSSLVIICVIILTVFFMLNKKDHIDHPYPYKIISNKPSQKELTEVSKAHVLLIGDKMGMALAHYIPYINQKLSRNLKSPLTIYNWSKKNESIVRTLAKIKKLKRIPPVVIYHGGSDEFYEKIFEINDYPAIMKNIKRFNHPYIQTALGVLPSLSKLVFKKSRTIKLDEIKEDLGTYTDLQQQNRMEIIYSLYSYHLQEIIKIVKQADSEMILLTTPLNFNVAPRSVCSNSTTEKLENHLLKINTYINEGKTKEAYLQLKELQKHARAHARVYYLLGKVSFLMGKTIESEKYFNLSTSFDCTPWRGNSVFNSIIEQTAISNRLQLIDFNAHVNRSFERRVLFSDVFFPQPIFYEEMSEKLISLIKQILQI